MGKTFSLVLIGLLVLSGNSRQPSSAEDPTTAKKRIYGAPAWSQLHLKAMKVPSLRKLAEKDRTVTVYRFLWLLTFHNPISVRFVKTDDGVVLHAVRLKGKGGYEPGTIAQRKSVKLNQGHWERIATRLEKAKFWTMSPYKSQPFGGLVVDGDILIVEGVSEGKYHVVVRHSPPGGDFVDLCKAMLFMSGIDVRQLWFNYR